MSYLNPTRIHFAGQFRADVSTVNNDTAHFTESKFTDSDQMPAKDPTQPVDGWWQPQGTGAWRIDRCSVTGAVLDGAESAADPVVGLEIRDTGDRVSAKLVDLDPDQQMVSTIFGLEVRIVDPVRKTVLMRGQFKPVAFFDLMGRAVDNSQAFPGSAFYQSVLTGVEWGDIEESPVLQALRAASPQTLSIKFMVDRYYMSTPERGFGRLVGTIGPQSADDPLHFTPGRFLAPTQQPQGGPVFGYVGCWLDEANRKVLADFGNALPTANGGLFDLGTINLGILPPGGQPMNLGELLGYSAPGWYERTAGIQAFPPDRGLTDAELTALASSPLGVALPDPPSTLLAQEPSDGIFLRPDLYVYRLEPSTQQQARAMALKFGQPLANVEVVATVSVTGSLPGGADALTADGGTTDPDGWVTINLQSGDPGLPRAKGTVGGGPDGQIYSVALSTPASTGPNAAGTAFWQYAAISIQVYSSLPVPAAPEWGRDVRPILQQYSNLYPRPHGRDNYSPFADEPPLHPVVHLSDPVQVEAYAGLIHVALQRHIDSPNHMPVTRDLSADRRQILLNWLAGLPGVSDSAGVDGGAATLGTAVAAPAIEATQPAQAPARSLAQERTIFVAPPPPPRPAAAAPAPPDRQPAPKSKMPSQEDK
jgi:hypothetical protein